MDGLTSSSTEQRYLPGATHTHMGQPVIAGTPDALGVVDIHGYEDADSTTVTRLGAVMVDDLVDVQRFIPLNKDVTRWSIKELNDSAELLDSQRRDDSPLFDQADYQAVLDELHSRARQAYLDELHSQALEMYAASQALRALAEQVASTHYAVAFSDDRRVCSSGQPIYDHSAALLKATIAQAYPELDAEAVWGVWADCQESVSYCASYVRREQALEAQETVERLDDPDEVTGVYIGSRSAEDIQDEARTLLRHAVESRDGMDFYVDTTWTTTAALALLCTLNIVQYYRGRVYELTATGKAVRRIMLQNTDR